MKKRQAHLTVQIVSFSCMEFVHDVFTVAHGRRRCWWRGSLLLPPVPARHGPAGRAAPPRQASDHIGISAFLHVHTNTEQLRKAVSPALSVR